MQRAQTGRMLAEYLTVAEAAEFLGVSPWTLRNWDRAGKLRPARHPVNGYRIYRHEDLQAVLAAGTLLGKQKDTLAPRFDWDEIRDSEHFVQFYETDRYLVQSVSAFVGKAMEAGHGAVVIATQEHRNWIQKKLTARGVDIPAAHQSGQYVVLDAAQTLSKLMVDDMPDSERFAEVVGGVIGGLEKAWPRVRAFGEMVSLLWTRGNFQGARRLEELWNGLAGKHTFALFCAYPLGTFDHSADSGPFHEICACHTRVIPTESYARLPGPDQQLREITALQQKATSLEQEIAQRLQAEAELALLASIVDSCEDAIISKTLDGTILSWNAGAESLFGYQASEAIGKSITLIIPPDRRDEENEILAKLRRGERIEHFDTVRVTKEGRLIDISLTISPIRGADGRILGASKVARDITERKEAEKALREAERRKDEFLATLAHELRNPLAPIRNSLHILRMSETFGPATERVHEVMERQVHHLVRLVDDLLELSRISRGKIELKNEKVELTAIINNAVETSRPFVEAGGHELELALPAQPIVLEGDPVRLAQVFANLLNNSAKYTDRGGKIIVTGKEENGWAVISVRDTGIGIPCDMLAQVFDMFAQVDRALRRSQDGLGIGLNLVRTLVTMHGGTVEAHSDGPGRGSEFIVRLPVADKPGLACANAQPVNGRHRAVPPDRPILVVDDNKDAADTLAALLKLLNADVHVVYDGASALEALRICRPSVVLLDIGMPDMDGYAVAQEIRKDLQFGDVTLIALTGWGQEEDRRQSREAGFDHHLVKPVDLAALRALLASLGDKMEAPPQRPVEPG